MRVTLTQSTNAKKEKPKFKLGDLVRGQTTKMLFVKLLSQIGVTRCILLHKLKLIQYQNIGYIKLAEPTVQEVKLYHRDMAKYCWEKHI